MGKIFCMKLAQNMVTQISCPNEPEGPYVLHLYTSNNVDHLWVPVSEFEPFNLKEHNINQIHNFTLDVCIHAGIFDVLN